MIICVVPIDGAVPANASLESVSGLTVEVIHGERPPDAIVDHPAGRFGTETESKSWGHESGVAVAVADGVFVCVLVGVTVGVFVAVGVNVPVAVAVGVNVLVAVAVGVNVFVAVGVGVNVSVAVAVGVNV